MGRARPCIAIEVLLCLFLWAGVARAAQSPPSAQFYVSPKGDDTWSGTLAEPNAEGTDGPFATVRRARDAVRELKRTKGLKGPTRVLLRRGTYRIAEAIELTAKDSGAPGRPVIYAAYPSEQPVISGGRRISGWKKGKDGLWVARVPAVADGNWRFRQLFVNGERRQRARTPNVGEGYYYIAGPVKPGEPKADVNRRAFRYKPDQLDADWTNPSDAEIVKFFG